MTQTFDSSALNTAPSCQSCLNVPVQRLPCLISCTEWNCYALEQEEKHVSSIVKQGEDSGMEPWGAQVYLLNCLSANLIFGTPLSFLVTSRVTWHLPSPETFGDFVGKLVFLSFWFVAGLAISSWKLPKSGPYPSFCFLGF